MNAFKYLLFILSLIIVISGCSTQNDPKANADKEDAESKQDPSVLLMQIKQLDQDLASAKNQVAELEKQLSEQQNQLSKDEEIYFLRNELDIMAHSFFSAIRFDEMDHVSNLLSERSSIKGNELITKQPDNTTMVYDLSWMKNMQSNLDSIRQRAYYLSDNDASFTSIYEFRPRPDEQGEFHIGILHVEFKKENNEWKIYHLYDDI